MSDVTLSIPDTQHLVADILRPHETGYENALHVAKALVAAEIDGQRGHGLSRVPSYAAQSASGKVNGKASPVVVGRKSAAVRIDAAGGFAYPALDLAISELTTLAKQSGVAAASAFRSHHFGQAGYHAERLAENGLAALVFGNSPKAIAPWGGSRGIFGTNPIAFAAPRANNAPLENLIAEMLTQDGVRLPGSRRIALRERAQRDGISIPADLYSALKALTRA